jgi:glutamate formiminotransferase/formiminotetrahydrofolate cyclodeaminase
MTLIEFTDELSSNSPAPGGGSVAALCGSLSAALSAMVAALSWSKAGLEDVRPTMLDIGRRGQALKDWFTEAVDADTEAFTAVIAARRLPRKTAKEIAARLEAIELANQEATQVPLAVLEHSLEALDLALTAAEQGNPNSVSDAAVAGACALAGAEGAALNIRINLPSLTNEAVAIEIAARQEGLLSDARDKAEQVRSAADAVLAAQG